MVLRSDHNYLKTDETRAFISIYLETVSSAMFTIKIILAYFQI